MEASPATTGWTESPAHAARVSSARMVAVPTKKRVGLGEIWRSRELARVVAARDLKVKYKQSLLGPPWLVLQPLGMLAALIVAFNGVADVDTNGVPYIPFALTGLAVWTLIQMTLLNGAHAFIQNALMIRRVACPRIAFVTGALLANLPAPAVVLVGALVTLLASGQGLPLQALLFPLIVVWLIVFTFLLVCVFASLAVRFRDIQSLLPFWSQAGVFLTPVGYSLSTAPGKVETVLAFNPLSGLMEITRWCLLDIPVAALPIAVSVVFILLLAWGGWQVFARMEPTFADVI
jgi:lipopolysaccharide transport system permease protein